MMSFNVDDEYVMNSGSTDDVITAEDVAEIQCKFNVIGNEVKQAAPKKITNDISLVGGNVQLEEVEEQGTREKQKGEERPMTFEEYKRSLHKAKHLGDEDSDVRTVVTKEPQKEQQNNSENNTKRKYVVFLTLSTVFDASEYQHFMNNKTPNIKALPNKGGQDYTASADYRAVVEAEEDRPDFARTLGEAEVLRYHAYDFPVDPSRLKIEHKGICFLEDEQKYIEEHTPKPEPEVERQYSVFLNITVELRKEELKEFKEKKPANIDIMPALASNGYIAGADYKAIVTAKNDAEAWALGEKKVYEEHAHEFPVADKSRLEVGRNALCLTEHEKEFGLDNTEETKGSKKMSTNNNTAKKFKPLKVIAIILLVIGLFLFSTVLFSMLSYQSEGLDRIEKIGVATIDDPDKGILVYDDEDEFKEYVRDSYSLGKTFIVLVAPGAICMAVYLIANRQKK